MITSEQIDAHIAHQQANEQAQALATRQQHQAPVNAIMASDPLAQAVRAASPVRKGVLPGDAMGGSLSNPMLAHVAGGLGGRS
jgi:hypothetical protein